MTLQQSLRSHVGDGLNRATLTSDLLVAADMIDQLQERLAKAEERLVAAYQPRPQVVPPAEDYAREYKLKVLRAASLFNETPDCQCDACWAVRDDRFMRIMRAVFNTPAEADKE